MSETSARQWLTQDPDSETRAELLALLEDSGRAEELSVRFSSTLEFGTAGIRGVLGAGPTRMNRVLVQKVSAGLGKTLLAQVEGARSRGVVIGYDGRHKSRIFAEDTARVLLGQGFSVYLSTTVVPTPIVAFAVSHYGAAAGVMVTASHNPPEYNGYKVYWENGAQIVSPVDRKIAKATDEVGLISELSLVELDAARVSGQLVDIEDSLLDLYLDGVMGMARHEGLLAKTPLTVAYTAMHGVGARFVKAALERACVSDLHLEPHQQHPDADFPTVAFPNPEEKGAMDLVSALAHKVQADLVLANDPDADRLAVALPKDGEFVSLTGDQVGVLLADYLLGEGPSEERRMVATTLVSSQLLGIMAKERGADYRTTLTGFKWIANAALEARDLDGARFVMGYEEALGYCVGELVRDKDGVSAAAVFCELAAHAKSEGDTVWDRLHAIYRKYGVFLTSQVSLVLPGDEGRMKIDEYMQRFRDQPPRSIGGYAVVETHDLAQGAMGLPASNVLVYFLDGSRRVIMRPSGTEPKLKCYYEVCEPVQEEETVATAWGRAQVVVDALRDSHQALLG